MGTQTLTYIERCILALSLSFIFILIFIWLDVPYYWFILLDVYDCLYDCFYACLSHMTVSPIWFQMISWPFDTGQAGSKAPGSRPEKFGFGLWCQAEVWCRAETFQTFKSLKCFFCCWFSTCPHSFSVRAARREGEGEKANAKQTTMMAAMVMVIVRRIGQS